MRLDVSWPKQKWITSEMKDKKSSNNYNKQINDYWTKNMNRIKHEIDNRQKTEYVLVA